MKRLLACLVLAACAGGESGPSRIAGLDVRLEMIDGDRAARFSVDRDGVLAFGGGRDAREERMTWQGTLDAGQCADLVALIERSSWQAVDSAAPRRHARFIVKVRDESGTRRFETGLDQPDARALYELLTVAVSVRFDGESQALPKPSMDTVLERQDSVQPQ